MAWYGGLRTLTFANGYSTLPTDRLFTGQTRDTLDTSNLLDSLNDRFYWGKSRYYDATIGRFHSPDNTTADPNNPLRLNRYAYADNNPLKYRDGSGHTTESPPEMTTPTIFINVAPPVDNKPLINVAPPITLGPLIFTGQLNTGTICITVQPKVEPQIAINVQSEQGLTIFKADSNTLDKNLGGTPGDKMDAHHIIPGDLEDHPLVQSAMQAGWNIDSAKNGILLPESPDQSQKAGLPYHNSGHPTYNGIMEDLLDELHDISREAHLTDKQNADILDYVTANVREWIKDLGAGVGVP